MSRSRERSDRRGFLSKLLVIGASSVALLSSSVYARGGQGGGGQSGGGQSGGGRGGQGGGRSRAALTQEQKDELFFIYQEEKVARDVYITLGKLYPNENTFASIQLSEQRHIDAAQGLCEKYGIDISAVDEDQVGNFVLPVLQDLYDTCIGLGEESLPDALRVGELVEVTDIKDLDHAINDLDMPDDVIRVYENLREGSYNHLEAFQSAIARV
ncbi:MAG: DUF2202 domain-containing protein [Campylobacterota bacterium]|nr:DUF2202 domain-containing protein [Campylobacterota bacterium]